MKQRKTSLTAEQEEAVNSKNGQILLAAAAGSGKTKVLVERIFSYLMGADAKDINQFLVITFTNDAAGELKHRIAQKLQEEILLNPENEAFLQRQLALLPQTQVSTIHGFCGKLIREHGHFQGINPGFRQILEDESDIIQHEVLELCLNQWYEKANSGQAKDFIPMVDYMSAGRTDEILKEIILDVYRSVQSHPNPVEWLEQEKSAWDFSKQEHIEETPWGPSYLEVLLQEVEKAYSEMKQLYHSFFGTALEKIQGASCQKAMEDIQALQEMIQAVIEKKTGKHWDDMLPLFDFKTKSAGSSSGLDSEDKKKNKEIADKKGKILKKLRSVNPKKTSEELFEDLAPLSPWMQQLIDVIIDFDASFMAEKFRRNVLDFGDLEHIAVKLLVNSDGTPSGLAESLSVFYAEILVDEYQDTNQVQNKIFSAVARRDDLGQEQNLFFVGDVKQSIYSFRQADPSIFMSLYQNFHKEKGKYPRAMLLRKNFRSRMEVLGACNDFFKEVMTLKLGGTDYKVDGMLQLGRTAPLGVDFPDFAPEVEDTLQREKLNPYHLELNVLDGENYDTTYLSGDMHHVEAYWVAQRVKKLLDDKFQVSDTSDKTGKTFRDIRYSDILILIRSYNGIVPYYEEAMAEVEIPFKGPEGSSIFQYPEVQVVWSLLRMIDNPLQEVPLVSVLYSPLFRFTADDLTLLRQGSFDSFYEALTEAKLEHCCHCTHWKKKWWVECPNYEEATECREITVKRKKSQEQVDASSQLEEAEEYEEETVTEEVVIGCKQFACETERVALLTSLLERRDRFVDMLQRLRQASWELGPQELLWFAMEQSNVMGVYGAMEEGEQRQERLLEFYRMVGEIQKSGYGTLFACLSQLEELKKLRMLPSAMVNRRDDNVVEMKSIHGAKGLEKPVVLVVGLGANFNKKNLKKPMLFHNECGLGPFEYDKKERGYKKTLPRIALGKVMQREMVSEELRLFYVAMTRAQEKLILSVAIKKASDAVSKLGKAVTKPLNSFLLEECKNMGQMVVAHSLTRPESQQLWENTLDGNGNHVPTDPLWSLSPESVWEMNWVDCGAVIDSVEEKQQKKRELSSELASAVKTPEERLEEQQEEARQKDLFARCEQRYQWVYPHPELQGIPTKFTPTQTKGRVLAEMVQEDADISLAIAAAADEEFAKMKQGKLRREPVFLQGKGKEDLTPTQRGDAIHRVMQYLNLSNLGDCDLSRLEEYLNELVQDGKITAMQKSVIPPEKIMAFLKSPWGIGAKESSACHQEFKFSLLVTGEEFQYPTKEKMLLQGVMDCWYENQQGDLVVIDFKSDKVPLGVPNILSKKAKDHGQQMDIYSKALKRITGKTVVSRVLWFFEIDRGVEVEELKPQED